MIQIYNYTYIFSQISLNLIHLTNGTRFALSAPTQNTPA